MLKIDPSRQARKFFKRLPPKHARQLYDKITELRNEPYPQDSRELKGKAKGFWRADVGEYRVVYQVVDDTLYLYVVGKRNDSEVYKILERMIR